MGVPDSFPSAGMYLVTSDLRPVADLLNVVESLAFMGGGECKPSSRRWTQGPEKGFGLLTVTQLVSDRAPAQAF